MLARSSHGTAWNYLTVQLNRLSEDEAGDPDLYGMFYGGTDVRMTGTSPCCSRGDPSLTCILETSGRRHQFGDFSFILLNVGM